jgi:hypothetical protein
MAIPLSSIGAKVSFAFETTGGTRPTAGYTKIPGITEIPEMNPAPELLDSTSMDNLEYTSGIKGLKTLDALTFTARFSQELFNLYESTTGIMASWTTAKTASKAMWLCIDIQGLSKSCYVSVEPSSLGMPAASANSAIDISLYFFPVGEPVWEADPTYVGET